MLFFQSTCSVLFLFLCVLAAQELIIFYSKQKITSLKILFSGYPMEQTEPKYEQFRKLKYAQETSFEVYTSFPIFNV